MSRMHTFNVKRFLLVAIAIDMCLLLSGCTASWVGEASSIVALLGPAISAALEILAAFGLGIPSAVATAFTTWEQTAQTALSQIATLINQYNAAAATAKPGILTQIQTLVTAVSNDLTTLLPTLHITDPATQAKVIAVFDAILGELKGLIALVPAVQAAVAMPDHVEAMAHIANAAKVAKLKSADQFKADFNRKAGALGKQYQLK